MIKIITGLPRPDRPPKPVEKVHAVISSIFNEAIDHGWCEANPTRLLLRRLLPPKSRRDIKAPGPFSVEDRDLFKVAAQRNCSWIEMLLLKVMAHAGLRVRNPHDLRYTYATITLMAHMSPAYVQRQLGHSSI